MNQSELATQIVEALLRKLEQNAVVAWEDEDERELSKLEAIWVVEGLLGTAAVQEGP